jgi:hypothetical protein
LNKVSWNTIVNKLNYKSMRIKKIKQITKRRILRASETQVTLLKETGYQNWTLLIVNLTAKKGVLRFWLRIKNYKLLN